MVTFALAIVAPEGSFMKPEMVPRSDCANSDAETIEPRKNTKTATRQTFLIGRLLFDDSELSGYGNDHGVTSDGITYTKRCHHGFAKVPLIFCFFGRPTSPGTLPYVPLECHQYFYGYWVR